MHGRREGSLRPEFQDWYPELTAGRWYAADELTALVHRHFEQGSPQWRPEGRIPSDRHFVFRGGTRPTTLTRRSRAGDPRHPSQAPPQEPYPLDHS